MPGTCSAPSRTGPAAPWRGVHGAHVDRLCGQSSLRAGRHGAAAAPGRDRGKGRPYPRGRREKAQAGGRASHTHAPSGPSRGTGEHTRVQGGRSGVQGTEPITEAVKILSSLRCASSGGLGGTAAAWGAKRHQCCPSAGCGMEGARAPRSSARSVQELPGGSEPASTPGWDSVEPLLHVGAAEGRGHGPGPPGEEQGCCKLAAQLPAGLGGRHVPCRMGPGARTHKHPPRCGHRPCQISGIFGCKHGSGKTGNQGLLEKPLPPLPTSLPAHGADTAPSKRSWHGPTATEITVPGPDPS